MSSQIPKNRVGSCQGHCRAQRFDFDAYSHSATALPCYCSAQDEQDNAVTKSNEDCWDDWTGRIFPQRNTTSEEQVKFEEEYSGCCTPPSENEGKPCLS